ncbi:MAG TPA: GNAT family N-acetyltransferase [Micromonosporaceae bacterium]
MTGTDAAGAATGSNAVTGSALRLRTLAADDWLIWRQLRLAALSEAPYAFSSRLADWQGDGDREERWRARLAIPGSYNAIALLDGEPVGMASGVPGDDGVAELISMWVAPAARGRGVGDALIDAVAQWARRRGSRTLRLAVRSDNAAARVLYERNGFRYTGELGDLMPDAVRHELVMAKPLTSQS